jgi:pyruvate kinase
MRKTKIVATVGLSTDSEKMLKKLIVKGVNVFRLNFSHATHEYHKNTIEKIRKVSQELGCEVAILQDISGPKIRICELNLAMELRNGDVVTLSKDTIDEKNNTITISYPEILDSLKVGEYVYFADGTIRTKVIKKNKKTVECEVVVPGVLTSKKGVNFPNSKLKIDTITPKDKKDLVFGAKNGVDIVALSFVAKKKDILTAREILEKEGTNPLIFPKIEKPEAMENLESILKESDGVMVARGDLGVELGLEKVASAQKYIIDMANKMSKPSIVATQMLTSMINSPYPTRAEVSDISNAVLDGADAVMLSDETTVGNFPTEAIGVLVDTIKEIEKIYPYYNDTNNVKKEESIAAAVTTIAKTMKPHALISFTRTGKNIIQLSRFRPAEPIIASSYDVATIRKLQIVWGVNSFYQVSLHTDEKELLKEFLTKGIRDKTISVKKKYVLTLGYPLDVKYPTNQIKLLDTNTMEFLLS